MQYGFVKVCAVTVEIEVAGVKNNSQKIIEAIKASASNGAQLTVFQELGVCGYTLGDLFNQQTLIEQSEKAVCEIAEATKGIKTLSIIGAPLSVNGKLYNCAVALHDGKILGVVPKTNIPNYGEFYEGRHFTPADGAVTEIFIGGVSVPFGTNIIFRASNFRQFAVGVEICEDLWVPNSPSINHAMAGATIIANLSCSDEMASKAEYRRDLVRMQSAKLVCGYVYCDSGDGESTTDLVFSGHNIICENGSVIAESKPFEGGLAYGEIDVEKLYGERRRMSSSFFKQGSCEGYRFIEFTTDNSEGEINRVFPTLPFVPANNELLAERTSLILTIQAKGLAKRLKHTHAKTAVIGVSGGLDSSLALLVVRRAFILLNKPLSDIIAITMPGFGTTSRTLDNSLNLMRLLGATVKQISIADSVTQHFKDIGQDPSLRDVTYENAQARMRTLILMDIANQTGGMVIGTGDLSELALGWATYNGDHMSMYAVNCSVPKTLIKHLVRYEAEQIGGEVEKVLKDVLDTEISPELLPPDEQGKIAQKTEDLVGPYVLHDFFLYYAVRWGFSPKKVRFLAQKTFKGTYSDEEIEKWIVNFYRRFFSQQFKRSCIPDGVKVGSVALSPRGDWRMPSDAVNTLWLDDLK